MVSLDVDPYSSQFELRRSKRQDKSVANLIVISIALLSLYYRVRSMCNSIHSFVGFSLSFLFLYTSHQTTYPSSNSIHLVMGVGEESDKRGKERARALVRVKRSEDKNCS